MLAPETPGRKTPNHRRKSDGVKTVQESPDIDSIKQAKVTPRRMAASLSLRRKTSFYSGDVSRNLQKAEEAMDASRLVQRSSSGFGKKPSNESDKEVSTKSQLFPHLVKDSPEVKSAPPKVPAVTNIDAAPPGLASGHHQQSFFCIFSHYGLSSNYYYNLRSLKNRA